MRVAALLFLLMVTYSQMTAAIGMACPTAGSIRYSTTTRTFDFCDPTHFWYSIVGGGALPGNCIPLQEGRQRFDSGVMQFCDGTNWISMKSCPTTTDACTTPGRQRYAWQTARLLYCDGAKWNIMYGGCAASLACTDHVDGPSCSAGINCLWNGSSCQVAGCSGYNTQPTCDADFNCAWAGGVCGDAI